jgi:hypothetical protein
MHKRNKNMLFFDWKGFRNKHSFTNVDFETIFKGSSTHLNSMIGNNNIGKESLQLLEKNYGDLSEFICKSENEVIMRGVYERM